MRNSLQMRSIRGLVVVEDTKKRTSILETGEVRDIESSWWVQNGMKDLKKATNTEWRIKHIYKLPKSWLQEFPSKDDYIVGLIIQETTSPLLYDFISKFFFGSYKNGREQKYKNVYFVYEGLAKAINPKFSSVRHALSHPELKDVKARKMVEVLFGSSRIDLAKRKHNLILKGLYLELEKEVTGLLDEECKSALKKSKEFLTDYRLV